MKRILAIWGKVLIELATANASETMPENGFESIGKIEDKTTNLAYETGEKLQLKGTGGELLDILEQEGVTYIETTVVEPTDLLRRLGLSDSTAEEIAAGKVRIKKHVVDELFALRLTPQRVGSWGVEAPLVQISFAPGGEEAKGGNAKLRFTFIPGEAGYLYDKVTKKAPASPGT